VVADGGGTVGGRGMRRGGAGTAPAAADSGAAKDEVAVPAAPGTAAVEAAARAVADAEANSATADEVGQNVCRDRL